MATPSPQLPPGQQLVAPGKWPTVGERTAADWQTPWRIEAAGLVDNARSWSIDELRGMPQTLASVDIHCVTRWSKLGVTFRGILLSDLLAELSPTDEARFVSFVAHSTRDHSTSLPLADALELKTLIALEADGHPLPPERGGPLRVVVPGRYFYKSLKWLARLDLLAEDRLGYWEAQAGYHNRADPWREQRYVASDISKQQAANLIGSRDFSGQDLRGIDAAGRALAGLDARGALLRDADFCGALLRDARFNGANLSNARLREADLRGAVFADADVEGADFTGADLRGADLRVASLLGATFCGASEKGEEAILDATTLLNSASFADLAPAQAEFVRRLGAR